MFSTIAERFFQSPVGQQFVQQAEDQARATREAERALIHQESARQVAAIEQELHALASQQPRLEADYQKKQAAADAARESLQASRRGVANLQSQIGTLRMRERHQLRTLADDRIADHRRQLVTRLDATRAQGPTWGAGGNTYSTNQAGLSAVLAAGLAAVRALDALAEQPYGDVAAAIAQVEATIPWDQLGVFVETRFQRA